MYEISGVEWLRVRNEIDWRSEQVSRFALLLLSSALMLVVAACDTSDDDATDDLTDDTTELPADDGINDTDDFDATNGDDDIVMPEEDDDALGAEGDDAVETDDEFATEPEDGAEGVDPEDDAMTQDDEMAFDDEDAAVDPEDMQPDPNQGIFFDLTAEEANDMTEFNVVEPEYVPEGLEFQSIVGMAAMDAEPDEMDNEQAATITFAYQQPPEDEMVPGLPVEFMQSTEIDMSQGLGEEADTEEMTIGDREVTRISVVQEMGDEIIAYVWNENDVHYSLAAILGDELAEEELEEMIASIPAA
jgi:hypothetical protein